MKTRFWLLASLVLGLAAPSAHAQTDSAPIHGPVLTDADEATLQQLTAYLNNLRTLKARFLQIGPDGKTSQGTAWLERPGRMRFEYDPPSPLLLVAGHGLVVFHDSQLDQTTNIPIGQTPLGLLLRDTVTLSGDVSVTDFERPPGQIQVTVVRTKSPGDGTLTLFFEATPLALTGWSVVDAQGNETQIKLSGRVEGASDFPDSLFSFVDPDFGAPQENR